MQTRGTQLTVPENLDADSYSANAFAVYSRPVALLKSIKQDPTRSTDDALKDIGYAKNADGSWTEHETTGTGFPKVFYLNYHLYKDYFPLLALSTFVKARATSNQ